MLAFTLFAVLAVILYGAFSVGHRAMEKTQVIFDGNQKFRSAIDLLGSYVRSSLPYRSSPQGAEVFYAGEETQVEFISSFSLAHGGRGLAKIRVYAENDGRDRQTIKLEEQVPVRLKEEQLLLRPLNERTLAMRQEEQPAAAISNTLVLRERVSGFRLAYLDPQDARGNWLERWDQDEHKGLPRAVRLSYRNENGKDVQWTFPVMMAVLTQ
jgi:hypothetical protein